MEGRAEGVVLRSEQFMPQEPQRGFVKVSVCFSGGRGHLTHGRARQSKAQGFGMDALGVCHALLVGTRQDADVVASFNAKGVFGDSVILQ